MVDPLTLQFSALPPLPHRTQLIRQFEMQQHEFITSLETQFGPRLKELSDENERLRQENALLRSTY